MNLTKRGFRSACVLSAIAGAALAAPSFAAAEVPLTQCGGAAKIGVSGSSLQKLAQGKWFTGFDTSTEALACSGTQGTGGKPVVTYTKTGSGQGLESWGVERTGVEKTFNLGPNNAIILGEIPPNPAQSKELEANGGGKPLTIPVVQAAVAVVVHLPAGCTSVTGGPVPGRLAFKESTLEKIFRGVDLEWRQILNGAKLAGNAECVAAKGKEHITRVVREDGSGTTASFMKFLNVVFGKPIETAGGKTWKELAEPAHNTVWPNEPADPVARGNGGGGLVAKVAAEPGSIGYAGLADARGNGTFSKTGVGGAGTATFWGEVENNKGTYADPSTDGDTEATANANCSGTEYVNGKKKFPPPTTEEPWNEVAPKKIQKNYPVCIFSYAIALPKYGSVKTGEEVPTQGEVRTAFDYMNFVLSGEGQTIIGAVGSDYDAVPTTLEIRKIAQEGVAKIGF